MIKSLQTAVLVSPLTLLTLHGLEINRILAVSPMSQLRKLVCMSMVMLCRQPVCEGRDDWQPRGDISSFIWRPDRHSLIVPLVHFCHKAITYVLKEVGLIFLFQTHSSIKNQSFQDYPHISVITVILSRFLNLIFATFSCWKLLMKDVMIEMCNSTIHWQTNEIQT